MKSITKYLLAIGALLCVALVFLGNMSVNPLLAYLGRHGLTLALAVLMAGLGVAMFPRTRNKRLVVKRGLMTATSMVLFVAAGLLLANTFGLHGFLAALLCHPGGMGCAMAAGSVVISEDQVQEFQDILRDLKRQGPALAGLPERVGALATCYADLQRQIKQLKQSSSRGIGNSGVRWIGNKAFVTDDCAEALTATFIVECNRTPNVLAALVRDAGTRQRVLDKSQSILGVTTRTALDSTTTPLPTVYAPQVIELVWKYGQARQYATVYPLGAGSVKLPRLKVGEDDFTFLGAGTAGMSQSVLEKRVTAELITFTANKMGGLIRIPTEIEEDTFIPLGQFLARYIGRQLSKLEDKTVFLANGTSTYANCTGVGPYCSANPTYLQQLSSGKTKPTDATLNDFRVMRSLINPAALVDDPAYYMNPTMEGLLVTFNTIGSPLIYRPSTGTQPATLDGFPIRWVGVLQAYSPLAQPSTYLAMFGALSYVYLGERGTPRIETSLDVFFATDEIAMRALERIDVEVMGINAMSALETAGS